jgi:predicted PurR-regulated permease PerM
VIAFILNFIPFIGSFVATLLPTFFAAAQFESLYAALVVFVGLNLLQFVIGSYIEPRLAGTAVSISPFMVLFTVFFWGVLWGVAGAFIGVPILIAFATVCTRHAPARPIAILLSADLRVGEKH